MAHSTRRMKIFLMSFLRRFVSALCPLPLLLDYLIRPREQINRNRQTNLFCRFKINDEFKLRRLLYGKVSRFCFLEDLIDVVGRAPIEVDRVRTIGHEAALVDKLLLKVNSRQPVFAGKLDDPLSFADKGANALRQNRA